MTISVYLQIETKYAKITPFLKIRQAEGYNRAGARAAVPRRRPQYGGKATV